MSLTGQTAGGHRFGFGVTSRWLMSRVRLVVAVALLVVALGIGIASVLLRLPAPFSVDANQSVVTRVSPGSYVWALRVRPGDHVQPWPPDTPDIGYTVDRGDGSSVSISDRYDIEGVDTLGAAAALVLLAAGAIWVGLPGASLALGLASAAAVAPLAPALGYPADLPLAALPPLITTIALSIPVPRQRRRLPLLGLCITLAVVAFLGYALLSPDQDWPWDTLWKLPAVSVLVISFVGVVPHLWRLLHGSDDGRTRAATFVTTMFPLARSSSLSASAAERTRLAAEIHNIVLPSLGQAILEVDAHDPAGRERLSEVVDELRQSMSERQSTVLERAGLVAAVRGYAEMLRPQLQVTVAGTEDGRCRREVEFAAYRIAQLALVNAVEHSGGDNVRIDIKESRSDLSLSISDDGVGLDERAEEEALARGHVGLAEMRRAASAVGAKLTIVSGPDQGTTVSVWFGR